MNVPRTVDGTKLKAMVADKLNNTSQVADDWFEDVFHTYWPRICGVLVRLVGDWAEAEDLALEVFWRLHQRPPDTQDERELGGWLYRVATHLGFNALRARKRRARYEEQAATMQLESDTQNNPAVLGEQAESRQRVRQVLGQMKPRAAQLLLLRHSGLSYAELATAIQVSPASIGTLLARAERQFEKVYQKTERLF